MADSTLDSQLFTLIDRWPGVAVDPPVNPFDMTSATVVGHNVVTAVWDVGTKWKVRNIVDGQGHGQAGWSTFVYLSVGTQNTAAGYTIAAKMPCFPDSATIWHLVTNDPDSCIAITGGLVAYAISAMTDAYFGWFWCGGVCPEYYVPNNAMGGNYVTDGDVAIGPISLADCGTADQGGLSVVGADTEVVIGYALAADA